MHRSVAPSDQQIVPRSVQVIFMCSAQPADAFRYERSKSPSSKIALLSIQRYIVRVENNKRYLNMQNVKHKLADMTGKKVTTLSASFLSCVQDCLQSDKRCCRLRKS